MSRSHSRVTGAIRVITAVWLVESGVHALADPFGTVADQNMPMAVVLPLAAASFTLGVFLLTGFATRACGLLVACLGAWLLASYGPSLASVSLPPVGVYLMLRGGGAWAMDIYVQKMQDRARRRVNSPESS